MKRGAARRVGQRIHHRSGRVHPHELSRHRRRRPGDGHARRRPRVPRRGRRRRSGDRRRAAADSSRATRCRWRRSAIPSAARRRVGLRDRQPARLRPLGDRRRRELPRPEAVRPEPRRLHSDRRGDQLRQQRRSADQRARPGRRHHDRHQRAGREHRLCDSDQPGRSPCCRSCASAAACRAATSASG